MSANNKGYYKIEIYIDNTGFYDTSFVVNSANALKICSLLWSGYHAEGYGKAYVRLKGDGHSVTWSQVYLSNPSFDDVDLPPPFEKECDASDS